MPDITWKDIFYIILAKLGMEGCITFRRPEDIYPTYVILHKTHMVTVRRSKYK